MQRFHECLSRGRSSPWVRVLAATLACGAVSLSLGSCENTSETDDSDDAVGNVILRDTNNYESDSSLEISTVETAAADLDICWDEVVTDIQCHELDAKADLDNVALLRFRNLSESQVEKKLASGQVNQAEVDGYLEYHTDHAATCSKLSDMTFLGTPVDVAKEYVESDEYTYLLLFAEGTTPGVGARAMTFVKPTASSQNTQVNGPTGCGILEFSANLAGAKPVPVPLAGPWVVDWRNITRDGQGNDVVFESIDSVLLAFYADATLPELQEQILDIELIATSVWEVALKTGGRSADLARAKKRGDKTLFEGFEQKQEGVWLLGLMCSTCQNPAPVVLAVLEPGKGVR